MWINLSPIKLRVEAYPRAGQNQVPFCFKAPRSGLIPAPQSNPLDHLHYFLSLFLSFYDEYHGIIGDVDIVCCDAVCYTMARRRSQVRNAYMIIRGDSLMGNMIGHMIGHISSNSL